MNANRLLAHFEKISDAPDAVERLRRFILDLAVRGKLVEQDPGEVGTRGPQSHPTVPFRIPGNWSWTPLRSLGKLSGGMTPSMSRGDFWGGEVVWLSPKDIKTDEVNTSELRLTRKAIDETSLQLYPPGSLFIVARSGILKRTLPVALNRVTAAANQDMKVLVPFDPSSSPFLQLMLRGMTPFLLKHLVKTGTTVQSLKYSEFEEQDFPLPPLAEQHRIVEKVDELMRLCDRLEASQKERESRRDRLVVASLNRLSQSTDPDEFKKETEVHLSNLNRLSMKPDHIKELRKAILNLAVRGKLVPQDEREQGADVILAGGVELPNTVRRRRKILKKQVAYRKEGEATALPRGWVCRQVQELYAANAILDYADGNHGSLYPRSSEFGDEGVLFATARDLIAGRVHWDKCAKLNDKKAQQLTKGWSQGGDVLLTHNATVGRVAVVEDGVTPFLLGTSVTFYRLHEQVFLNRFFFYFLQSDSWQSQLQEIMAQTTRNQVSIQKQALFRVVVPPLAEQKRIVAKVDELMLICDQLENQLESQQKVRRQLLEALMHEALEGVG